MQQYVNMALRGTAYELVRAFVSGEITNWEFEDQWPRSQIDELLEKIEEQLWLLYDDGTQSLLQWKDLSFAKKKLVVRMLLFLTSALIYEWPQFSFRSGFSKTRLLLSQKQFEKEFAEFCRAGDIRYWPFKSRTQFQQNWKDKPKHSRGSASKE